MIETCKRIVDKVRFSSGMNIFVVTPFGRMTPLHLLEQPGVYTVQTPFGAAFVNAVAHHFLQDEHARKPLFS